MLDVDWREIFVDYYSGMSQRALERKYDCTSRIIQARCKYIINVMMKNNDSFLSKNIDRILQDISKII